MRAKTFKQFVNERFEEMKKPSLLDRVKKKGRDLLGMETKSDREILNRIKQGFETEDEGWCSDVRFHKQNRATARLGTFSKKNLIVIADPQDPEIVFGGKKLDVANVYDEAVELLGDLRRQDAMSGHGMDF